MDADVQYNMGLSLQELQRYEEALASYDKALDIDPNHANAYNNRGIVLKELMRYEDSLRSCDRAIALKPDFAEAYCNRGNALGSLGRYEDALESYDQAISLKQDYAEAYYKRGLSLQYLQRYEAALASYDQAISLKHDYLAAHLQRANTLAAMGRYEDALASYDQTILLCPGHVDAHNNRGNTLQQLRRYEDALASYDQAISLSPDYAMPYYNRADALSNMNRHEEAVASFDQAIALKPDFAEAYNNRGRDLRYMHRYQEALASFEQAIAINPGGTEASYNKGLLKLLLGDYQEGWRLYESRWKTKQLSSFERGFKQPLWLGDQSIINRTILLHAEQGFGDIIQFVRYVPMVEALGAKVILEVPSALVTLVKTLKGAFTLITKGDSLPEFDFHCPLMSFPLAFKTNLDTIPADVPYLATDPNKQREWRKRLGPKVRPRLGLTWSGSALHKNDLNRSIRLRSLEPLMRLDFEFHSLQKGIRDEDRTTLAEFTEIQDHDAELHDFADTAALVAEMDLVITVDTSVAHLAGALGKEVWIMLPYDPDYRWLTERSDSPWYPTARLFRQDSSGNWESVIKKVYSSLQPLRFTTS